MVDDTDALLVKQVLAGDKEAFESIIGKYHKVVYNVALRLGNSDQDAQDISQSVFIKVFEGLASFNPKYKFFSWIYRIALNESLNFLNQANRFEELDDEIISQPTNSDTVYDDVNLREMVQEGLMELKLDYRVVIVLNHFQDLSYDEISYILDIPKKTVKSRLFTARQCLRAILLKKQHTI